MSPKAAARSKLPEAVKGSEPASAELARAEYFGDVVAEVHVIPAAGRGAVVVTEHGSEVPVAVKRRGLAAIGAERVEDRSRVVITAPPRMRWCGPRWRWPNRCSRRRHRRRCWRQRRWRLYSSSSAPVPTCRDDHAPTVAHAASHMPSNDFQPRRHTATASHDMEASSRCSTVSHGNWGLRSVPP